MLELILTIALIIVVIYVVYSNQHETEKLIGTINKQIEFIDKNIKERVVYTNTEYSNEERFYNDKNEKEVVEEEIIMPEDLTPEELQKQMEGKNK